jgi:Integrase core domain
MDPNGKPDNEKGVPLGERNNGRAGLNVLLEDCACATPRYLIRDNDRAFGVAFKDRVRAMGIRDRPISFRSPWQNGYVERLIGSIRRECTDHLIVFNAEHLRRILAKYTTYYNEVRTHVSLGKDVPRTRPIERFGDIVAYPILGGLHHRYARI